MRSGRSCGGYTVQSTSRPSPAGVIKAYSIPFKVPGSQVDRQLLHFYCSEAAERLAGFSDPTLWTQLILQRCHHQPIIRGALVALSSLYLDNIYSVSDVSPVSRQPRPNSMEIIAKCHRQLSSYLRTPGASTEVALICGLIFYTFECLVGDATQATWHLDQSLRLLQRTLIANPHAFTSSDGMSDHLISMFTRLDVQASIFDSDRLPELRLLPQESIASSMPSMVPDFFVDSSHAEDVLTRLQNFTMHHIISYVEYKSCSWDELPMHIRTERLGIVASFQKFESATTKLLAGVEKYQGQQDSPSSSNRPTSHQHILLLQTQAEMFHSILVEDNTLPPTTRDTENAIDNCLDAAVSHISSLLDISKQTSGPLSAPGTGSGFMLSTQIIACLYYICMKAQNRRTRQKALELLQDSSMPEREGLWDAKSAVFVVQSMIEDHDRDNEEDSRAEAKLEDFGSGIVDAGGLDSVFELLKISRNVEVGGS